MSRRTVPPSLRQTPTGTEVFALAARRPPRSAGLPPITRLNRAVGSATEGSTGRRMAAPRLGGGDPLTSAATRGRRVPSGCGSVVCSARGLQRTGHDGGQLFEVVVV